MPAKHVDWLNPSVGDELNGLLARTMSDQSDARLKWDETSQGRRLGLMLVRIRKAAEMTQQAVAEKAGWNKTDVSRLEGGGESIPTIADISRFASACGVRIGFVAILEDRNNRGQRMLDAVELPAKEESGAEWRKAIQSADVSET